MWQTRSMLVRIDSSSEASALQEAIDKAFIPSLRTEMRQAYTTRRKVIVKYEN
ncbi:hypothetical protein PAXRUDRAFT_826375 [Paxillus rubicundulus Ve08.2h10]|uniref:Uncharacterized protein n=1 Tax=Paxillus rubicundulus Ve08.2h10 TaxID=930991 RepID=A0A0D0DS33_9AGAM|nr:hypothetical protein PAXRUDRAFT_826375 [Paxillus rubicundulus Ve08.2h10]